MSRWTLLATKIGRACRLGEQLSAEDDEEARIELVKDAMFGKANNTLSRRLSSLCLFIRWLGDFNLEEAFPPSEGLLYEYLVHLRKIGAPPTRAQGFLEALFFAKGMLGLPVTQAVLESTRLRGAALRAYEGKRLTRKSFPLTTKMVIMLEDLTAGADTMTTRIFAGFCCWTLYARGRAVDMSSLRTEPILDTVYDSDRVGGFAEAVAARVKNTRGLKRRRLGVQVVAPVDGLSDQKEDLSWANWWIGARMAEGLSAFDDEVLMPTPSAGGGWLRAVPMSAPQLTSVLQKLLVEAGMQPSEAAKYTSHSLKSTTLSWCAKAGMTMQSRRLLGGHVKPGEKSVLEYSRDALAGPLRELAGIMAKIRSGEFDPDETRSGRWKTRGTGEVSAPSSDDDDSTSGSGEAVDPEDEAAEDAEAEQALASMTKQSMELLEGFEIFHNTKTSRRHLAFAADAVKFLCGIRVTSMYARGGSSVQPVCKSCLKKAKTVKAEPVEDLDQQGAEEEIMEEADPFFDDEV